MLELEPAVAVSYTYSTYFSHMPMLENVRGLPGKFLYSDCSRVMKQDLITDKVEANRVCVDREGGNSV